MFFVQLGARTIQAFRFGGLSPISSSPLHKNNYSVAIPFTHPLPQFAASPSSTSTTRIERGLIRHTALAASRSCLFFLHTRSFAQKQLGSSNPLIKSSKSSTTFFLTSSKSCPSTTKFLAQKTPTPSLQNLKILFHWLISSFSHRNFSSPLTEKSFSHRTFTTPNLSHSNWTLNLSNRNFSLNLSNRNFSSPLTSNLSHRTFATPSPSPVKKSPHFDNEAPQFDPATLGREHLYQFAPRYRWSVQDLESGAWLPHGLLFSVILPSLSCLCVTFGALSLANASDSRTYGLNVLRTAAGLDRDQKEREKMPFNRVQKFVLGVNLAVYLAWKSPRTWWLMNRLFVHSPVHKHTWASLPLSVFSNPTLGRFIATSSAFYGLSQILEDEISQEQQLALFVAGGTMGALSSHFIKLFLSRNFQPSWGSIPAVMAMLAVAVRPKPLAEIALFPAAGLPTLYAHQVLVGMSLFDFAAAVLMLYRKRTFFGLDHPAHLFGVLFGYLYANRFAGQFRRNEVTRRRKKNPLFGDLI